MDIFCTGTQTAFLTAAYKNGLDICTLFKIQTANAFWSIDFMGRERKAFDFQFLYIQREFHKTLHSIDMDCTAWIFFLYSVCQSFDIQLCTSFVVYVDKCYKACFAVNCINNGIFVHDAVFVRVDKHCFKTHFCQIFIWLAHSRVFVACCNYFFTPVFSCKCKAINSNIVAFAGAGCEIKLFVFCTDTACDKATGFVHLNFRCSTP